MNSVTQKWMHNLSRRRQLEKLHAEIEEVIKKNNLCAYEQAVEEQNQRRRFSRAKGTMEMERQMESQWLAQAAARKQREKEIEDDERLAKELNQRRQQEAADEFNRIRVRNDSMDIRELEAKLRAAYVQKELHAQIVEKQATKYDQEADDAAIVNQMEEARRKAQEVERKKQEELRRKRLEVQHTCYDMAKTKEEVDHALAVAEFRRDRLRVEEVLRAAKEREDQERRMGQEKKDDLRRSYWEAYEAQKAAHEEEAERQRQEDEKIKRQVKAAADRDEGVKAKRQARQQYLHELSTIISQRIINEEKKKLEMEDMRLEVYTTKARQEEERAAEQRRERRRQMEQDLRKAYEEFKANELRRKIEDTEQQAAIRRALMADEAEKELKARKADEERRRREKEFAEGLRQQFVEKLEEFHRNKEQEQEKIRQLDEELKRDLAIQEEERLKILREHVPNLIGYLPKGVFRSEEDAAKIGIVLPKTKTIALDQLEN